MGGTHPSADAALLLGVVAAQRPLTHTPAVLFLCGKAVGHPVKALAAVLGISHDQAAAAAVVGAQLPVGNKLLYVDLGNALASQKLAVQMADLSAAAEAHGVLGLALDHDHAGTGFNRGTGSRRTGLTAAHNDDIGGVLLCKFGDCIGSGAPALTFCGALAGSGADHRFTLGLCYTVCNSILNGIRGNGRTGMTVDLGALSLEDLFLQLIANALAKALGFTGNIDGHICDALSVKGHGDSNVRADAPGGGRITAGGVSTAGRSSAGAAGGTGAAHQSPCHSSPQRTNGCGVQELSSGNLVCHEIFSFWYVVPFVYGD